MSFLGITDGNSSIMFVFDTPFDGACSISKPSGHDTFSIKGFYSNYWFFVFAPL